MRIKPLLFVGAALAVALPALAHQVAQTQPAPTPTPAPVASTPQPNTAVAPGDTGASDESA